MQIMQKKNNNKRTKKFTFWLGTINNDKSPLIYIGRSNGRQKVLEKNRGGRLRKT